MWSQTAYADPETELKITELLLQWPQDSFDKIAVPALAWLDLHAKTLPDAVIWPLWDRIATATLVEGDNG
jgi:hypothetical protein